MNDPTFKRIHIIVLDSVGIGEAPDADQYNDAGADTLGHIAERMNGLKMPHMGKLGLSNIKEIEGIEKADNPLAYYTKMQEASDGKDTMTGHWEINGSRLPNIPSKFFPMDFQKKCYGT